VAAKVVVIFGGVNIVTTHRGEEIAGFLQSDVRENQRRPQISTSRLMVTYELDHAGCPLGAHSVRDRVGKIDRFGAHPV
jgi:hypothetical protein